jgi:ketosteroid isomerase-like protein
MAETTDEAVVRRSIEAWNRDDWDALEAVWHVDGDIVAPPGWPESGVFRGWSAIRSQFERLKAAWSDEHIELVALETIGDHVLADVRWHGRGESGLDFDLEVWMLNSVRGGRLVRVTYHFDEGAARASAAGGTA